jgi:hypothetical protein
MSLRKKSIWICRSASASESIPTPSSCGKQCSHFVTLRVLDALQTSSPCVVEKIKSHYIDELGWRSSSSRRKSDTGNALPRTGVTSQPSPSPEYLYSVNIPCSYKERNCGGVVAIISRASLARGTQVCCARKDPQEGCRFESCPRYFFLVGSELKVPTRKAIFLLLLVGFSLVLRLDAYGESVRKRV